MKEKIKVIIKDPGEKPRAETISNTLEEMQTIVGGYIETVTADNYVAIVNEEGIRKGLMYNITWGGHQLFGTVIFCGVDGDEFDDYPELGVKA